MYKYLNKNKKETIYNKTNHMDIKALKKIIREIIQSEIEPEERGGGVQARQKDMGMWHTEEGPMYQLKSEDKLGNLWHIKDEEKEKPPEMKKTPDNTPGEKGGETEVRPDLKKPEFPELEVPDVEQVKEK